MNIRSFLAALLFSPLLISASLAQQVINPSSLVGKWSISAKHPSGAMITTTIQLTQNMKFTTSSAVDERPFMVAAGSWALAGTRLEWRYESSSQPVIQPGFVDVDEVISVNETELTVNSKLSGKTSVYHRIQ